VLTQTAAADKMIAVSGDATHFITHNVNINRASEEWGVCPGRTQMKLSAIFATSLISRSVDRWNGQRMSGRRQTWVTVAAIAG